MGTTGHGMDFLAIRRRSVTRSARWKLADSGTLRLHHDEDFGWARDADAVAGRCHVIAAVLALTHRAPVKTVRRAVGDHDLGRWMGQRELDLLPGVVLERLRALEWLFHDVPWEEVDLRT